MFSPVCRRTKPYFTIPHWSNFPVLQQLTPILTLASPSLNIWLFIQYNYTGAQACTASHVHALLAVKNMHSHPPPSHILVQSCYVPFILMSHTYLYITFRTNHITVPYYNSISTTYYLTLTFSTLSDQVQPSD